MQAIPALFPSSTLHPEAEIATHLRFVTRYFLGCFHIIAAGAPTWPKLGAEMSY